MVITIWLHMYRVFLTGSYKPPREFNWGVGVILLVLTLLLSFTGYLLPWDQLAIWAITVGSNMARATPFLGYEGPGAHIAESRRRIADPLRLRCAVCSAGRPLRQRRYAVAFLRVALRRHSVGRGGADCRPFLARRARTAASAARCKATQTAARRVRGSVHRRQLATHQTKDRSHGHPCSVRVPSPSVDVRTRMHGEFRRSPVRLPQAGLCYLLLALLNWLDRLGAVATGLRTTTTAVTGAGPSSGLRCALLFYRSSPCRLPGIPLELPHGMREPSTASRPGDL